MNSSKNIEKWELEKESSLISARYSAKILLKFSTPFQLFLSFWLKEFFKVRQDQKILYVCGSKVKSHLP